MSIDWSVYDQDGLEKIFFGLLYRVRHSHGDRRLDGEQPYEVDGYLGVPITSSKLKTGGNVIPGIRVAMETALYPDKIAANLILTSPGEMGPDDKGGEAYHRIPRNKWPTEVASIIAELTYRWKKFFLYASTKNWVILEYPLPWKEEFKSGIGKDKLPVVCHATHEALEHAERTVPGTIQAKGPTNALATASEHDQNHARKEAEWYYKEFQAEGGRSSSIWLP